MRMTINLRLLGRKIMIRNNIARLFLTFKPPRQRADKPPTVVAGYVPSACRLNQSFHCDSLRLKNYRTHVSTLTPPQQFDVDRKLAFLMGDKPANPAADPPAPASSSYLLPPTAESKRFKKEKRTDLTPEEEEQSNKQKSLKKAYVKNARDPEAPKPPEPPAAELCCMSGCGSCVWMVYADELMQFYRGRDKDKTAIIEEVKNLIDDPSMREYIVMELKIRIKDHPTDQTTA